MDGIGGTCLQTVRREAAGTRNSLETAVYHQLTDEEMANADRIKTALYTAFATDEFTAYEHFITRWKQPDEFVDVC